jgi:hypothetical protein
MSTTHDDARTYIGRAVDYLAAIPLPEDRWVYTECNGDPTAYVVDATDMTDLGRRLDAHMPDAYSLWCGDTSPDVYPSLQAALEEAH